MCVWCVPNVASRRAKIVSAKKAHAEVYGIDTDLPNFPPYCLLCPTRADVGVVHTAPVLPSEIS